MSDDVAAKVVMSTLFTFDYKGQNWSSSCSYLVETNWFNVCDWNISFTLEFASLNTIKLGTFSEKVFI